MKIRLVKGPFGGKMVDHPGGGQVFRIRGPKRMTRKQRYEWEKNRYNDKNMMYGGPPPLPPYVEAEYKVAMRPHHDNVYLRNMPCMHPDGSIFYEWTGYSREF